MQRVAPLGWPVYGTSARKLRRSSVRKMILVIIQEHECTRRTGCEPWLLGKAGRFKPPSLNDAIEVHDWACGWVLFFQVAVVLAAGAPRVLRAVSQSTAAWQRCSSLAALASQRRP